MKTRIQWTITRFYTETIYSTLIFQLCTQHFSTTVLGVLGFSLFVFLLSGINRISISKIATRGRTISLYMHTKCLQLARLAHAVFKNLGLIILYAHKLSRLVHYFASPWFLLFSVLIFSSSFGVFYLQIYLDMEVQILHLTSCF